MPAGLQAITDQGVIQIDGESINPCLITSGTLHTVDDNGTYESVLSMVDIPIPAGLGDPVFLAILPNAAGSANNLAGGTDANGQKFQRFVTDMPIGTAIRYWVFARPAAISSSGFGMEINSPSGELIYSLGMKPMRAVAIVQLPGDEAVVEYAGLAGRSYAAVFGGYAGGWRWVAKTGTQEVLTESGTNTETTTTYVQAGYGVGVGPLTNGLTFAPMHHSDASKASPNDGQPQPGTNANYPSQAMIIDVTGY